MIHIPHLHASTTPNTAKMADGYNTFNLPANKRHTASVKPASDAASTRSSSSFASTIGLLKEKNADNKNKDNAKKQAASISGTARFASTMINQC